MCSPRHIIRREVLLLSEVWNTSLTVHCGWKPFCMNWIPRVSDTRRPDNDDLRDALTPLLILNAPTQDRWSDQVMEESYIMGHISRESYIAGHILETSSRGGIINHFFWVVQRFLDASLSMQISDDLMTYFSFVVCPLIWIHQVPAKKIILVQSMKTN